MSNIRSAAMRVCALAFIAFIFTVTAVRLLAADVVISNTGMLVGTTVGLEVGQSFTATKAGRLTKI
jgi:hypothetical protein